MTLHMTMEVRDVDEEARTIEGTCVPYDEVSYLTSDANGERVKRGAFRKSIEQRGDRILLFRQHEYDAAVGRALELRDDTDGLYGRFKVADTPVGLATLHEVNEGVLPGLSVGFRPIQSHRLAGGIMEVTEAKLLEVSLVTIAAYDSAGVTAVRATTLEEALRLIGPAPDIDLSPIAPPF